jgi:hypothetical protein
MALFDSADCLARFQRDSGVPATTAFPTTADIYSWLTQAQAFWKPKLAAIYPYAMLTAPTLMTTADSGVTFQFPSESAPLAVEIYPSLVGERMIVGQFPDTGADYVWEVSQIRMPANQSRNFSDGAPYARWVGSPGTIDANTQPTMLPAFTRQLLVDRALIYWATRGGLRDPAPFEKRERDTWAELEESLRNMNPFFGDTANRQSRRVSGLGYLLARGR